MAQKDIFKLDNGNYAYRIAINRKGLKIDTTRRQDDNGNPFTTMTAAKRARDMHYSDLINPSFSSAIRDTSLSFIYNHYINNGSSDRQPSTIRKQKSMWDNHIKNVFGDVMISAFNSVIVNNYLSRLYYDGDDYDTSVSYSYAYVEGFLKFFYLLFGYAYRLRLMDASQYQLMIIDKKSRITMPKIKQFDFEENTIRTISDSDLSKIDDLLKNSDIYTSFLLGRFLALRISEVFALRWSDFDLNNFTVTIRSQLLYQDGIFCLCPVKTLTSVRTLELAPSLCFYLKKLKVKQQQQKDKLGIAYRNTEITIDKMGKNEINLTGSDYVNRKSNGELLTINSWKYWVREIKKIGIDFKFHYLRHTTASALAALNTPAYELMRFMGHKKISTTYEYYIGKNQISHDKFLMNLDSLAPYSMNEYFV